MGFPAAHVAPSCSPLFSQELSAMFTRAGSLSSTCSGVGEALSWGGMGRKSPPAPALCLQALWLLQIHIES